MPHAALAGACAWSSAFSTFAIKGTSLSRRCSGPWTHFTLFYHSLETLYTDVEMNLKIVQTAAVLEIIHAAIGFVKSPVITTFMQGTPPSVCILPPRH